MKKSFILIVFLLLTLFGCSSPETVTPVTTPPVTAPPVTTPPVTTPPVTTQTFKPAIINNIRSITNKIKATNTILLINRSVTYNTVDLNTPDEVLGRSTINADVSNTFINTIVRWYGSESFYNYDTSAQLHEIQTYTSNGSNTPTTDIKLPGNLTSISFDYTKLSVQTTNNNYKYNSTGDISACVLGIDTIHYEYDNFNRLAKVYTTLQSSNTAVFKYRRVLDYNYELQSDKITIKVSSSYSNIKFHIDSGIEIVDLKETLYNFVYYINSTLPGIYENKPWYKINSFDNIEFIYSILSRVFKYTPTLNFTQSVRLGYNPTYYDYIYDSQGYLIKSISTTKYSNGVFADVTIYEYK